MDCRGGPQRYILDQLWVIAAVLFFVPGALVIKELSSRFPEEGGLYVWAKKAFGDFHGFVAGWTYWIYTVFYFPGLLLASATMSAYVIGRRARHFPRTGCFCCWFAGAAGRRSGLNIIGLNIGKWLQNAGGVGTYLPLLMLVGDCCAVLFQARIGDAIYLGEYEADWNWDTVNFWSQIAFAFTGLELVSCMSEEVRDPRRTLPARGFGAGALIAFIYVLGTFAILTLLPAADLDPKSGVFHGHYPGSVALKVGFVGVLAAVLVSVGNAGGVGSTVAGIARVPFVVGIDRYLAGGLWKNPSEMEDTVYFDSGAGWCVGSNSTV